MSEFVPDILEQVLILLDVKDLIICTSVCKSWKSFITSPHFVKSHLNHNIHKNNYYEILNKRLIISSMSCPFKFSYQVDDLTFDFKECRFLGTCNGLVCISPFDAQVLVANPSTRQVRKLIRPQVPETKIVCWGFGYDSFLDDYKVVLGFRKGENETGFQALTLKTNVWRTVGEVKYVSVKYTNVGTLCNGALHWFMKDANKKKVILCFDLCKEEFKEIPQPDDARYDLRDDTSCLADLLHTWFLGTFMLGMDECLCILCRRGSFFQGWVMNNYKVKSSWDFMSYFLEYDMGYFGYEPIPFPMTSEDVRASVFVQSLVSPYPQGTLKRKRQTMIRQR